MSLLKNPELILFSTTVRALGGVYMRKLAPARVSCRDDFFMSYRVYIMTGSFHISLFEGTLHVDKVHVRFKIADITGRPISHRNGWSFRVYMIPLRDFAPGEILAPVSPFFSPSFGAYKNRGELTPGTRAGMTFCGGTM